MKRKYFGILCIEPALPTILNYDLMFVSCSDALENGSDYPKTRAWLAEIKIVDVEISDCEIIHKVSAAISTRAANLCAACKSY